MNRIAFILIHLAALLVFWTGYSTIAIVVCLACYLVRMFSITAGYHRYFSHRSYKTSRVFQFLLALVGSTAVQKGPLWWAAHHRYHHRFADTEDDIHSPLRSLWWSHAGWVLSKESEKIDIAPAKDFMIFPELNTLDRLHYVPPILFLASMFLLGWVLNIFFPGLGTSGLQMAVWGGFISTVFVYHCTFAINSLAHIVGRRRFETKDLSRNSFWLALITLGEGWHNNHHRYPVSERQGYYWWEIDITHYILKFLGMLGIVWDLKAPPQELYEKRDLPATHLRRSMG